MTKQSRKAFEAWAQGVGIDINWDDADYVYPEAYNAHMGWQARGEHEAAKAEELVELIHEYGVIQYSLGMTHEDSAEERQSGIAQAGYILDKIEAVINAQPTEPAQQSVKAASEVVDVKNSFSKIWLEIEYLKSAIRHKYDYTRVKEKLAEIHEMCRPHWDKFASLTPQPTAIEPAQQSVKAASEVVDVKNSFSKIWLEIEYLKSAIRHKYDYTRVKEKLAEIHEMCRTHWDKFASLTPQPTAIEPAQQDVVDK